MGYSLHVLNSQALSFCSRSIWASCSSPQFAWSHRPRHVPLRSWEKDYFTQAFANDGSNSNLQVGVDGRNSQASVSIPLAPSPPPHPPLASVPHLAGLQKISGPLWVSVFSGAMTRGTQSWGCLGASGCLRLSARGSGVKGSGLNGTGSKLWYPNPPPTAHVCEEDHTRLFSFVIPSLLAPRRMLDAAVLHPGEFFLAQLWICLYFWHRSQNNCSQRR